LLRKLQAMGARMPLLIVFAMAPLALLIMACTTVPYTDARQGEKLADAGQYQQAIAEYTRSINLLPSNPEPYLGRGYVYEKMGEYQKALSDYSQAIALNPSDPQAYFVRGLLYDLLGKTREAVQDYSMTISLKPNDADAYYYRGIDREKLGNTDGAKADYKNAVTFGRVDAEERLKALGGNMGIEGTK
jgi:tetratricopeptide (TPR) repeat protein